MNEELKVIISAEIDKLKQGIDGAKKQVKSLQDKFADAKKTIKDDLEKVGEGAANAAGKIGAGFAAMGAALIATAASTEEYRNQQAQLMSSFEAAGKSAEAATETYNGLYRVLGDTGQAQEAAQHLAKLGVEEQHLSEYTHSLQGVYATFGASLPLEGLTEAINHTAKLGEVQGPLADALEWSGLSTAEFNEKLAACNTESEREKLIRETLTELYGNAADVYEKNNAQVLAQREAQAKLQDTLAKVGEAIAPLVTAFTTLAADVLAKLTPYITDLAAKYMPQLEEILSKVADAIGKVIDWVVSHWDLVSTIATVILTIVAAFTALNTAMKVVNAVMALFNANPIVLAITAVIAVIVLCVKHWDDIKAAAKKAWEAIKNAWNNAGTWFKTNIVDKIKNAFSAIDSWMSEKFGSAWTAVKNAFAPFVGYFKQIWENVKGIFSAVKSVLSGNFKEAWETIKQTFAGWFGYWSNLFETIKGIFSKVGTAIANGIKGAVTSAVNSILKTAAGIINGFISAINFAIGIINKIPGVNISKLSKLEVPQMAQGGVVDSATLAVIGERGKEAVVPLENNLEWLNKLAGMLNERMGGGNKPIILQVDGKTFAQTTIDSINNLTRQTGTLGLAIV